MNVLYLLIFLVLVAVVWHVYRAVVQRKLIAQYEDVLNVLPFLYSILWRRGWHTLEDFTRVYTDWPVTFLIAKEGEPYGKIGCSIAPCGVMHIMQLQGLSTSGHQIATASYLLECAEKIASVLGLRQIFVQRANSDSDIDMAYSVESFQEFLKEADALRRTYDVAPTSRGYCLPSHDSPWRVKTI